MAALGAGKSEEPTRKSKSVIEKAFRTFSKMDGHDRDGDDTRFRRTDFAAIANAESQTLSRKRWHKIEGGIHTRF